MKPLILLDSGPLGFITNPKASTESSECNQWIRKQLKKGVIVYVPDIADYEVRRELLRANKTPGIKKLDDLRAEIGYAPITTEVLIEAASFWAQARQIHKPTAADAALDGDMILCGHAEVWKKAGYRTIIATTNVKHLSLFADARVWWDIF